MNCVFRLIASSAISAAVATMPSSSADVVSKLDLGSVQNNFCGPMVLCQALYCLRGQKMSLSEMSELAGTDPKTGTSLLDIKEAAKKLNIGCEVLRTNMRALAADERVKAIVVDVDAGRGIAHLALIESVDSNSIHLINGPTRVSLPIDRYSNWEGLAVLFSDKMVPDTGQPFPLLPVLFTFALTYSVTVSVFLKFGLRLPASTSRPVAPLELK